MFKVYAANNSVDVGKHGVLTNNGDFLALDEKDLTQVVLSTSAEGLVITDNDGLEYTAEVCEGAIKFVPKNIADDLSDNEADDLDDAPAESNAESANDYTETKTTGESKEEPTPVESHPELTPGQKLELAENRANQNGE